MNLDDKFYYDETSPSCLRYSRDTCKHKEGDAAGLYRGSEDKGFYWTVKNTGGSDKVHRIILELHGIDIEGLVTDHLNGDSSDNRLENLRACTLHDNARNNKLYKSNSTGVVGVNFLTNASGNTFAHARYYDLDGKRISKYFSLQKYGVMVAFRNAVIWRESKIKEINDLGAGYTERHGLQEMLK
jgi:hypothetical protein